MSAKTKSPNPEGGQAEQELSLAEAEALAGEILKRPIAFYPIFARIAGSVTAGIMLSQFWYWKDKGRLDPDGWFYKTQVEWEAETALSRYEQEGARKVLRTKGFIKERRRGQPAKLWFLVDTSKIVRAILKLSRGAASQVAEIPQPSMRDSSKLDRGSAAILIAASPQSFYRTENTSRDYRQESTAGGGGRTDMSSSANSTTSSRRPRPSPEEEEAINRIFTFWQQVMGHPKAKLNRKRRNAIFYRLRENYTAHEIMLAIEGCRMSEFHMGANDQERAYDDIELICRDGCKLDGFIEAVAVKYSDYYTHCNKPLSVRDLQCPHCKIEIDWRPSIEKRLQEHSRRFRLGARG